jgi:hypothetical protein
MSVFTFIQEEDESYNGADVGRIVQVFADKGHTISRADARAAWEKYSDSMCAGWLVLHEDDDDLFEEVATECIEETI